MNAQSLRELLSQWKLRTHDEKTMQCDLESVLTDHGIAFDREHRFTNSDIIDFLVGGVGIECKVKGSKNSVLRQMIRYASFDSVRELILVTTRGSHLSVDGQILQGKPVSAVWINNL